MEEDKQQLGSHDAVEADDVYSLVLELSENDPLFEKKKKLLCDKGFGMKESIHIKRSCCPDSLSTALKLMLQIARIIHLDEVELYFREVDPLGHYSTRNEMEALNWILSLVDASILSQLQNQKNGLQDLRISILSCFHELAAKNTEESRVDKNYSCDKENCLIDWAKRKGVQTNLQIAYIKGAGRGAIAVKDLDVGDIALEIPLSIIISEELVHKSDMYQILEKIDGMTPETMLLLWSMKEKHNCNSDFKIYFDTLPEHFNTGLSFGVDAIMTLEGTLLLEELTQAKEHLRTQYDALFPELSNAHPDIFPSELYTWEHFLWACELWYSNSLKIMFADGKLRTCLIPVASFLNHSLYPHIVHYGKIDSATNSLKFPLSRPCSAGEQCCLRYGSFSSSHLITFYGFLPEGNNPYDVIPLDFDDDQADGVEDCPLTNWTTHMVRGTWMSNNHDIFYYGLPSPLLDYLRRAWSPTSCTITSLRAKLECDNEILENLLSIFSGMMDGFGDTESINSRNASWDVKLAVKYNDLQKMIVSSILTACYSGKNMVKHELSKGAGEE
ncbi:hypothetical protein SLA2020_518210 [Shorea laevis]